MCIHNKHELHIYVYIINMIRAPAYKTTNPKQWIQIRIQIQIWTCIRTRIFLYMESKFNYAHECVHEYLNVYIMRLNSNPNPNSNTHLYTYANMPVHLYICRIKIQICTWMCIWTYICIYTCVNPTPIYPTS